MKALTGHAKGRRGWGGDIPTHISSLHREPFRHDSTSSTNARNMWIMYAGRGHQGERGHKGEMEFLCMYICASIIRYFNDFLLQMSLNFDLH